jgi:hypothetical protein
MLQFLLSTFGLTPTDFGLVFARPQGAFDALVIPSGIREVPRFPIGETHFQFPAVGFFFNACISVDKGLQSCLATWLLQSHQIGYPNEHGQIRCF